MDYLSARCAIPLIAFFVLNGCSNLNNPCGNHMAICKEIKRQIVFNTASSNKIVVNQQSAELPRLLKAYHDEGCE